MDSILQKIKKYIPKKLFNKLQPSYHYGLAFLGALKYKFPSREIMVIGVTGTKGKSTVVEILNAIFEEAGYKTALAGTVRFKIDNKERRNMRKMTMPGRFFVQKFIRDAINAKCQVVFLEMTSEGVKQFRHKFIDLDALVFTNLSPEHIESHGSYENYIAAKVEIAKTLETTRKKSPAIIVNIDDEQADKFLALSIPNKITYKITDADPISKDGKATDFNFEGNNIHTLLPGKFNIYNTLSALSCAKHFGIKIKDMKSAIMKFNGVRGRMEEVTLPKSNKNAYKQDFTVIVDYAHTPDSLKNVYEVWPNKHKTCVLGGCGGGRDDWKRKVMGGLADNYCDYIILTDEDPYDEDPRKIVTHIEEGIRKTNYSVIMDRREAISEALKRSIKGDVILITGKGTDPYIMRENGTKEPWDDAQIVRDELEKILKE